MNNSPALSSPAARWRGPWMAYALAALLTPATLIMRLALGFRAGDPPNLILFTLPVMLSAYLGGLGPGLVATALAVLLANTFLLQPYMASPTIAQRNLIQSGGLLMASILISMLSEGLHRARRQAEAMRRLHAMTLASIGDGVITTDSSGSITFLNAEAERLTGWSSQQAVGQPISAVFRVIDSQTRAPLENPAMSVLRTGQPVGKAHHTTLIARTGRETQIDDSGAPISSAGAVVCGAVLVFRDVGTREQAETVLHESQERLAGIVGAAMDAIISIDAAQRIVVFNAAAEQMFGCPAAAALGQPLDRFIPASSRTMHAAQIQAFGQTGVTRRSMRSPGQLTALRADGTEFPIEATISQTRAAGQPLYTVIMRDISRRLQAEQALRLSESRFTTAFRASPIAMSITGLASGRFIDINTSHERLFGYARDELVGQHADTVQIYADPNQRAEVVRILREHGALRETELTLRTKTGELREVLCSLETIELEGEACILGSVFDITARKRAEAALRASEERFRLVFLANPAPKLITRADNRVVIDANPAFARMTGYTHDELVGQTTDALGLWPESKLVAQTRAQLRESGELMNREIPMRTRDGELRDLLLSIVPIELDGVAGFLTVMLDQTERKRAERAQRRAAARLRVLADASRAFAEVGTTYQGLLSQIAQTTATMLGEGCTIRLLSEDAAWLPVAVLYDIDPQMLDLASRALAAAPLQVDQPSLAAQAFQQQRPLLIPLVDPAQVRAATKPEYRSLVGDLGLRSLIFVPMRVHGRAIGVLTLYRRLAEQPPFDEDDLTLAQDLADRAALAIEGARLLGSLQAELAERTSAEAAVRTLSAELEQRVAARTAELTAANKELEAFSYSVSHDLRAPLRAIDGFTRILLDEYVPDLPAEAQSYFELVRSNTQQMARLIDDLLTFARLTRQPLALRTADSAALVRQCLAELQPEQAERHIQLRIGELPACQGDPALLKQVWFNLIANALKYTRQRDAAAIEIGSQQRDGQPIFFIKDNGVGFDMRYSDKLFGVFQRLHRAEEYEGTGVGLAIVQRIIQRHGGQIWAEAAPNQGAAFYFTLAAAASDPARPREAAARS